jgi:hypothetical protein
MSGILSFCESQWASGHGLWHLRWLDGAGPKFGGGITTVSLCGNITNGWDLEVPVTAHHLANNTCPRCASALAPTVTT